MIPSIPPELVDHHLDAVLRAAGSGLRYYTLPGTLQNMREAMAAALDGSHATPPETSQGGHSITRTALMRTINNLMTSRGCSLSEDQDAVLCAALGALWDDMPGAMDGAEPPAAIAPLALSWVRLTDRMPNPEKHPRVLIYTEGYEFGGEQVFDVPAETLNECLFAAEDDQPEVCRAASHWMPHPESLDLAAAEREAQP